ncbi:MAG: hypothetical protein AVDCRST_MAG64-1663 [uncultured Phycisphaerae bacterium]|uniref:Uncharacterized protein n=1 Tax=uncultured Phycisphaerae bacterium TaxID=904963 RepID=A0A6J4NX30_9BACT|nr:MAG: hypothetical protein AVDCRST_MAG64-1663 [uncultured Phycisphaerae bacterium]
MEAPIGLRAGSRQSVTYHGFPTRGLFEEHGLETRDTRTPDAAMWFNPQV